MVLVQSACRTAAATCTAKRSLALLPLLLPRQQRKFSTSRSTRQDRDNPFARLSSNPAAAATPRQPSPLVNKLRQSLRIRESAPLPPRPPPVGALDFLDPAAATRSSGASLEDLPDQIRHDADASRLETWKIDDFTAKHMPDAKKEVQLRLRPSTGRTINVSSQIDVNRAFSLLSVQVRRNQVARDFMLQRFHERPALKRKRKLREGWRMRFKAGVNAAISRTMQLRTQGW